MKNRKTIEKHKLYTQLDSSNDVVSKNSNISSQRFLAFSIDSIRYSLSDALNGKRVFFSLFVAIRQQLKSLKIIDHMKLLNNVCVLNFQPNSLSFIRSS